MKHSSRAIATIGLFSLLGVGLCSAEEKSDANWIRLKHVGEQDKPIPTIWIAIDRLTISEFGLNETAIVTREGYHEISRISRSLTCSTAERQEPSFGTMEISESVEGNVHDLCTLSSTATCSYLSRISDVSDLDKASAQPSPIANLRLRLGCK